MTAVGGGDPSRNGDGYRGGAVAGQRARREAAVEGELEVADPVNLAARQAGAHQRRQDEGNAYANSSAHHPVASLGGVFAG